MSPQPHWRSISFLPALATHIHGMLEADEEQYTTLLKAKDKPYVLDGFTVNRIIEVFTKAKQDLPLFDEQLHRWESEQVTTTQRQEIIRLQGQMDKIHEVIDNVLRLANELSTGTIEKQMAKSDVQLGREYLIKRVRGEQQP
jgi:hypothetical protein